jgi:hypothetical protein
LDTVLKDWTITFPELVFAGCCVAAVEGYVNGCENVWNGSAAGGSTRPFNAVGDAGMFVVVVCGDVTRASGLTRDDASVASYVLPVLSDRPPVDPFVMWSSEVKNLRDVVTVGRFIDMLRVITREAFGACCAVLV